MYGSASASVQFDSSFKRENTDTRLILPVEGILELLQTLKKNGYRLYLLSNAAIRQHEYLARAEASKLMDGTLISADVKLLKTDPQIYQTFLKKFDLKAEECVFIDDPLRTGRRVLSFLLWRNKIMVVWIDIVLFMCAAAFLVVGIVQLKRSKQAGQDALDTFTNRRNAVSCICLGILFVIVVICISL